MKVSAIPAYYPKYFRTKKNSSDFNSSYGLSVPLKKFEDNFNFLIDANYSNILMAKRLQAFKGVPSAALKTIPIEEKIATIFEKFNHGDLLLIGKDLRSAKNAMKKSVVQLKSAVKKVFFIEEHELPGSIAFFKNDTGKKEFINISDMRVTLKSPKANTYFDKGDSLEVDIGDVLKIGSKEIPIKLSKVQQEAIKRGEKAETLNVVKDMYTKVIPVEKQVEKSIENVNLKTLENLVIEGEAFAKKRLTLADVGGQEKAITELKKGVLLPLKNPDFYVNRRINRGFILEGGPGTGKTLAAKALANDSGMSFIQINGPEIESKWVGESEENLRKIFQQAKDTQPSIILFDEIDAIAKKRNGQDVYGDKIVNQFLAELTQLYDDGDNVFVLATTNRADMLDDAIVRSKRFGKIITFELPQSPKDTKQILEIHTKDRPLASDYNADEISKKLFENHLSGADIAQIVEDAHDKAFERLGLFEKMELGTATKEDLASIKLTRDDFENALIKFKEQNMAQKKKMKRNPIGFNAPKLKEQVVLN